MLHLVLSACTIVSLPCAVVGHISRPPAAKIATSTQCHPHLSTSPSSLGTCDAVTSNSLFFFFVFYLRTDFNARSLFHREHSYGILSSMKAPTAAAKKIFCGADRHKFLVNAPSPSIVCSLILFVYLAFSSMSPRRRATG